MIYKYTPISKSDIPRFMMKNEATFFLSVFILHMITNALPIKDKVPRIHTQTWSISLDNRSSHDENSSGSGIHVSTCGAIQQNLKESPLIVFKLINCVNVSTFTSCKALLASIKCCRYGISEKVCWSIEFIKLSFRFNLILFRIPLNVWAVITEMLLWLRSNVIKLAKSRNNPFPSLGIPLWERSNFASQYNLLNVSCVIFKLFCDNIIDLSFLVCVLLVDGSLVSCCPVQLRTRPRQWQGVEHVISTMPQYFSSSWYFGQSTCPSHTLECGRQYVSPLQWNSPETKQSTEHVTYHLSYGIIFHFSFWLIRKTLKMVSNNTLEVG